jgi:hypothetical protein
MEIPVRNGMNPGKTHIQAATYMILAKDYFFLTGNLLAIAH